MKIHFCDLCNESVPEADFKTGRAFLRQGRVVCATCEALMSSDEAPAPRLGRASVGGSMGGAAATFAAPSGVGGASAALPPLLDARGAGAGTQGGGWVAVVALLLAVGSAWYLWGELDRARSEVGRLEAALDSEVREVRRDLDSSSQRARDRERELELRLSAGADRRQGELEASLLDLRDDLRAAVGEQESLEVELARLAQRQENGERDLGRRLDDLTAQSLNARQTLDGLATRIEQAEAQGAARAAALPLDQIPVGRPAHAAELADLRSDTAGTRWNAVQSLGETGDPEVVPHLLPLFGDPDVFVRMAVARVCGDLANPVAVDALIDALEDEEPVVREAAMAALHIITGRDFRFDPAAKPPERAKRVKAWREWWAKAKGDFLGDA